MSAQMVSALLDAGLSAWTRDDARALPGLAAGRNGAGRFVLLGVASCLVCRMPKVRRRPEEQGGGFWCFGCGRRWA